jgi:hypothetical protein
MMLSFAEMVARRAMSLRAARGWSFVTDDRRIRCATAGNTFTISP